MPSPFRSFLPSFVASANVLSRPFCFHEWKIAPSVLRSSSSSSSSATPLSSSLLLLESTPIPISESSFLSSSFSFAPRLDGHRSRSIALSHSRISRIRLRRALRLVLYLLSLSLILIPFIVDALARLAHPRSSSITRSCALTLSRPRSVLPTLHGLLRPALTSVRLLQSTPSRRARWLRFFLGFELSHCAASYVRLFSAR